MATIEKCISITGSRPEVRLELLDEGKNLDIAKIAMQDGCSCPCIPCGICPIPVLGISLKTAAWASILGVVILAK